MKNFNIGPFKFGRPQAARIKRFEFDFHTRRRADMCQYLENIVPPTKQVQNRAHAKTLGQIDSE